MATYAQTEVITRVPGTTANLGPGFDTLGIALKLYNYVKITPSARPGVVITSPIAEPDRPGATAMIQEAAQLFFQKARKKSFGFSISLTGDVPIARGLGSSVTARLGVVAGLNEITEAHLSRESILDCVTHLEHHPDNAAPAIFGGFTVAGMQEDKVSFFRFPVSSSLHFVTLIPRFEVSTEKARKLVPKTFSKADTIHSLNRSALITAAFAAGQPEKLAGLFEDKVHQPYREKLIPQLSSVIEAGERAGAIGGWLSGSGSTIMCLTVEKPELVGHAMQSKLRDSDIKILQADNHGFKVRAV